MQHGKLSNTNDSAICQTPVATTPSAWINPMYSSSVDRWDLTNNSVVQSALDIRNVAFIARTKTMEPLCKLNPKHLPTRLTGAVCATCHIRWNA